MYINLNRIIKVKQNILRRLRIIALAMFGMLVFNVSAANACCSCCLPFIHNNLHDQTVDQTNNMITTLMDVLQEIIYSGKPFGLAPDNSAFTFWGNMVQPELQSMTRELSLTILNYPVAIGGFLDGQNHEDKITALQIVKADAQKDHIPAVSMCEYASLSKSLAASQTVGVEMTRAISQANTKHTTLHSDLAASLGPVDDIASRYEKFKETYCLGLSAKSDHAGFLAGPLDGSDPVCSSTSATRRRNFDINFSQLVGAPKTIMATLYAPSYGAQESLNQFEDLVALSRNLYGSTSLPPITVEDLSPSDEKQNRHILIKKRALMAKRNVAQHSFANYLGLKAPTNKSNDDPLAVQSQVVGLLLQQGVTGAANNDFTQYVSTLGSTVGLDETSASYWAQMEMLTKKLYQDPRFFANLYDNPANVLRQQAAMKAIDLMQERDIHESSLRTEMLMSLWLDMALETYGEDVIRSFSKMKGAEQ